MPNMVYYLNGSILAELHYNSENKPVRSITFAYESTVDKLVKGFKTKTTDGFIFGLSYQVQSVWNKLREKKERTYDEDGDVAHYIETVSEYTYDNAYLLPSKMVTTDSKGGTAKVQVQQMQAFPRQIETLYKYPFDLADAVSTEMTVRNMISVPVETTKRLAVVNGNAQVFTPLHWTKTTYALTQSIFYLPQLVQSKLGAAASPVTDMQFLSYDNRGNLLTFQDNTGSVTKLEYFGAADLGKTDLVKNSTTSEGTTSAHILAYNYKPSVGIELIQDPNAKAVFYDYDDYLRLKSSRSGNAAGALRTSYCYNFAGQVVECPPVPVTGVTSPPPLTLIGEQALPVTLLTFEATPEERSVLLNWSTSSETNSSHFAIERSADGKQWQELGTLQAQVESDSSRSYVFTDSKPRSGENLYRLRMVDLDGTFAYSRIRSVFFDTNGEIVLFPNPLTLGSELRIQTSDPSNIRQVQLIDTGGKQVLVSPWKSAIPIENVAAGLYLIKIIYKDGGVSHHRIVKQ